MRRRACSRSIIVLVLLAASCSSDPARPPVPSDARGGGDQAGDSDPPPVSACPSSFAWPDPVPTTITPSAAWKTTLGWTDAFIVPPAWDATQRLRWAKFIVLTEDPTRVFYQDGNSERFHAEFAVAHLDPFIGMTPAEFNQVALHAAGQRAILGTLLFPEDATRPEALVQLHGYDVYHPQQLVEVMQLVAASLSGAPVGAALGYYPAFEQQACAAEAAATFATAGFALGSPEAWLTGSACYVAGWAVGTLRQVAYADIPGAFASGALAPDEILLTDAVPAEVPTVAGILTLSPSTPNSHVAILARAFAIPFAFLRDAETAAAAQALVGRTVGVAAEPSLERPDACRVRLFDLETYLTPAEISALVAGATPPPIDVAPRAVAGALAIDVDDLGPSDIAQVGGKAAHYGLLRDVVAAVSPDGLAFTFDLWDRFMAQPAAGGGTLAAAIAARLGDATYPPADMQGLLADLAAVRAQVKVARFAPSDEALVLAALAGFDPAVRLRVRSSTNVEDSATFTGAGLYDSATGCLADDLDADGLGPSACNAAQADERGVLRAIARVYASFYNDNAFLERRRRGVDEATVAMALLVHPSYPDVDELANGVALVDERGYSLTATMATQLGALSVANPEPGAIPELVQVDAYSFGTYSTLRTPSSLVPLGATVLTWDADWPTTGVNEYVSFADLFGLVADHYATVTGRAPPFGLDLEYKKMRTGLIIKQVRPLPAADSVRDRDRFLVGQAVELCVFQGEASDVIAIHRLKSRWLLTADSRLLDAAGIAESFYLASTYDYVSDATIAGLAGVPSTWPGAAHRVEATAWGTTVVDELTPPSVTPARTISLRLTVPAPVSRAESPFVTFADVWVEAQADHSAPVPTFDWSGPTTTVQEFVPLTACTDDEPLDRLIPVAYELVSSKGTVTVNTALYWPQPPDGIAAGYTAPLVRWGQTTISGLTSAPIVLRGYWAQTYRPAHHNFGQDLVFEPRLDPEVPAGLLAELAAADIVALYVDTMSTFYVRGADGSFRLLE